MAMIRALLLMMLQESYSSFDTCLGNHGFETRKRDADVRRRAWPSVPLCL